MDIKFCGMTRADDAAAAEAAGATHIGLIFVPASRRFVSLDQARKVASAVSSVVRVALLVEPEDSLLDAVSALPIDMLQLHGQESPERVAAVRARTGLPVMKAVGVRDTRDMAAIDRYAAVADRLLIDAKPPEGAAVPGGHGVPFDWTLLAGRDWTLPWMLAGGLTPENVAGAIAATGAPGVDLASGVESAPGIKDPDKMRAFVAAARGDN